MKVIMLLAALSLVSCRGDADDRICLTAPTDITPGNMNECVHKWAYRLAASSDPATTVAKAVVRACDDVARHAATEDAAGPAVQAAGNPAAVRAEFYATRLSEGEKEALFRVVQARAGHCDIP